MIIEASLYDSLLLSEEQLPSMYGERLGHPFFPSQSIQTNFKILPLSDFLIIKEHLTLSFHRYSFSITDYLSLQSIGRRVFERRISDTLSPSIQMVRYTGELFSHTLLLRDGFRFELPYIPRMGHTLTLSQSFSGLFNTGLPLYKERAING